jgi:large subunit ribosomal protein L25
MKEVVLEAELREISSKHNLKALRSSGKIPGVFYGHNEKAVAMSVNAKKFMEVIQSHAGSNVLINLKLGAETKNAIVKEVQRDVLTQLPMHIDFQAVNLKEKVEISVPIHAQGTSIGVKLNGGILEHVTRELKIRCLPMDIPEAINFDVTSLDINQSIAVKDLPKLEGVEVMTDASAVVFSIVAPTEEVAAPAPATEAAAGAAARTAEPEVIAKGKKEEEAAEGATKEAAKGPSKK